MKTTKLFSTIISFCFVFNVNAQFICGDSLLDVRDGQKYATVLIGSDCWFKQNLNYGLWVISDSSGTFHSDVSNNSIPEKYAQENDSNNLAIYGGLYEWNELMNYASVGEGQGICPNGWHVSTESEWLNLITTAGGTMSNDSAGNGGNKLKKTGVGVGMGAGTDNVGFSALLGGDRGGTGEFWGLEQRGIFWTSTLNSPGQAYHFTLWTNNDTIENLILGVQTTGFSCRCVENSGTGLEENEENFKINIYPNPATNEINVRIGNNTATLTIYNSIGANIYSKDISEFQQINCSKWEAGFYYFKLCSKNGSVKSGIIIKL